MSELGALILDPLPFWPKPLCPCGASQHLWLVATYDVYQRSTYISHTTQSEPSTTLMLAVATVTLRGRCHPWRSTGCIELVGMKDTLVPGAPPDSLLSAHAVTSDAHPGRIPVAEDRVVFCRIAVSSVDTAATTATCTTSCRTLTAEISCQRVGRSEPRMSFHQVLTLASLCRIKRAGQLH